MTGPKCERGWQGLGGCKTWHEVVPKERCAARGGLRVCSGCHGINMSGGVEMPIMQCYYG
jgi:hypothetical protein